MGWRGGDGIALKVEGAIPLEGALSSAASLQPASQTQKVHLADRHTEACLIVGGVDFYRYT